MFIGRCPPAAAFRVCLFGVVLGWAGMCFAPSHTLASTRGPDRAKGEDFQTTGSTGRAVVKSSDAASPAGISQTMSGPTIVNVPVCTAIYDQFGPQMVSDGAGGSILVWQDYREGGLDVYAQRLNGGGPGECPPNAYRDARP